MIQLLVNADDFGFSRGVNYGIVDAHRFGIVNSTTMLVNMPGTEQAVELAKQYKTLRVGIHLTLTCGIAVSKNVPTLTTEDGSFKMRKHLQEDLTEKLTDIEKEWEAQIQRFYQMGLTPTHFDSHHHVHAQPELLPVVRNLSKRFELPVRNVFGDQELDINRLTDVFLSDFYNENVGPYYFDKLEEKMEDGVSVEVMCHPAYVDYFLNKNSSYSEKRIDELNVLTTTKLPKGFQLV
ncbi:chitin disaccharide deacetylase [Pseudalkalibacillus decolorationis]|uniref:chitin disaccharide deacetylase n=1 Tax=Pseudalkalibacillus decolorationis TaxID=163879 RepID=UPI002147BF01|nr:chitin disaccharide deacetylase [Pseudalkalibacillus decolorationis]